MTHERFVPALDLVESLPVGVLNAKHLMLGLAPQGHPLLGEILALGVDSDLVARPPPGWGISASAPDSPPTWSSRSWCWSPSSPRWASC